MALLDAMVLPATVIAALLFYYSRPALQPSHSEEVMVAFLGRSFPLDVLVLYLFVQPLPSRNPDNRLDEIIRKSIPMTTMISLLFSKIGDTYSQDDSFYVMGMLYLGAARLVSLIVVAFWWLTWRRLNPHWALTGFMSGGYRRTLLGQSMIVLGVALVLWRPTTGFITLLYFLLLLNVAAMQMVFWLVCRNKGTWWAAVSGILLLLSHLPMIATGHGPMSKGWSVVVYYMAQTAYTLSAIHASIGGASILLRSRG